MLNNRQTKMLQSLYGVAVRGQRARRPAVGIAPDMLLELIQLAYGNRDLAKRIREAETRLDQLGVGLDELTSDPALPLFYRREPIHGAGKVSLRKRPRWGR